MDIDQETNVTWREWEMVEKGEDIKVLQSVFHEACAGELKELISRDMDKVKNHIHTKRVQAQDFEDDKACRERVLQIYVAMNYSCEYQNEVQTALWSRESVILPLFISFIITSSTMTMQNQQK